MNKLQALENKYNKVDQELTQAIEAYNLAKANMERLQEERARIKKEYRKELDQNKWHLDYSTSTVKLHK